MIEEAKNIRLREEDRREILRYLEYHDQEMEESLREQISGCMETVNRVSIPRFTYRIFDMEDGRFPGPCAFLTGEDIRAHVGKSRRIILMAATLGAGVEQAIRIAQLKNPADSVIMDACASTLIEALCDETEAGLRKEYGEFFLSSRFSPGYGDLPIGVQREFCTLLDTGRSIGVFVSGSGILIPRKSVTAVLGMAEEPFAAKKPPCSTCNHVKACRFLRRGVTCSGR